MRIELRCICESTAVFDDAGGTAHVQKRAEDWLDRHDKCVAAYVAEKDMIEKDKE